MVPYILILPICLFELVFAGISPGTRLILNKRSVKSRAFNRACQMHECRNTGCNNEDGWRIYGSDLGCCGNYAGCCQMASVVCYLHDVMCKCCDYGWLICGPDCRREPECDNNVEANKQSIDTHTYNEGRNEIEQNNTLQTTHLSDNQSSTSGPNTISTDSHETEKHVRNNVLDIQQNNDISSHENCSNLNHADVNDLSATEKDLKVKEIQTEHNHSSNSTKDKWPKNVEKPRQNARNNFQDEGFMKYPKYYKQKFKFATKHNINKIQKFNYNPNMFLSDQPRKDVDDETGSGEIA